jgi:regulatory protein
MTTPTPLSDDTGSNPGADYQRCLDAASRYLGYRPRSVFEVKTRLRQRGFDQPTIEAVLRELGRNGSLDDLAFASFWRDNRQSFSPRSGLLLGRELRAKGVAKGVVTEVVSGLDEEDSAYRAAVKRATRLDRTDFTDFRARLTPFLRRRGFSYQVIERAVRRLWDELGVP